MRYPAIIAATAMCITTAAHAAPITYTESAVVNGSLGGSPFSGATIVVTVFGDTDNIVSATKFFSSTPVSASFTLTGHGGGTITEPTFFVFDNQAQKDVGFANTNGSFLDTFGPEFATYALDTSIGPITGSSFIRDDLTFSTSIGQLVLTSAGNATFSAVLAPIPEPVSMTLLATGMATLPLVRRRTRA